MKSDVPVPSCSIIVPVYNDSGYLSEALASVLGQSVAGFEVIVVDDGSESSEHAPKLLEGLDDPRLRLVRHDTNRGLAAARNTGIRHAEHDVIVTLDSDDKLDPRFLEGVLPSLAPGSPFNCAFTDTQLFGAADERISRRHDDLYSLLRLQWIPATGVAFRRSLWEAIGGYCEDPVFRVGNEDREFWVAALERGLMPRHIAEPLVHYRVGHPSMSQRLRAEEWQTRRSIILRHKALYRRHRAERPFLADGYLLSAEAVREQGYRRRAIRLAMRALAQQPWRWKAVGIIGRALLPARIHHALRDVRRGGRD